MGNSDGKGFYPCIRWDLNLNFSLGRATYASGISQIACRCGQYYCKFYVCLFLFKRWFHMGCFWWLIVLESPCRKKLCIFPFFLFAWIKPDGGWLRKASKKGDWGAKVPSVSCTPQLKFNFNPIFTRVMFYLSAKYLVFT